MGNAFQKIVFWFILQCLLDILPGFIELFELVVDQRNVEQAGSARPLNVVDLKRRLFFVKAMSSCQHREILLFLDLLGQLKMYLEL